MKVVVGMSGGVDSAVSAYLLDKEGYEVIGLFMKNWDSNINSDPEGITDGICPQEQDFIDAKKVCDYIGIPLYRVDFIKEYWDTVFSYFLSELKKGITPNQDIMCNKYIKFDLFKKEAKKLGADLIATGHYARHVGNKILRGVDNNKDQTYFLSQVKRDEFKDILFPVGDYTKPEVREIAIKANLPVATKKDSTGICFIGERHYQQFVENYLKGKEGDIVYVAFGDDNKYLMTDEAIISDMNYISDLKPTFATCKFRYRGEDIPVTIEYLEDNKVRLLYEGGAKAVTPGQACVIYLGSEMIAGGIIETVKKDGKKLWYL